ncbi:MAG: hypothetical protein VXZ72_02960 [Chlamydiota bacterium]|nr:hypothetical protein [Chlamydiota bacterium]
MSSGEDLILTRQDGRPKLMSIEDNTHRYSNIANAVAVGDVVYISASDTVAKADVDGSGTLPPIGVVQSLDGAEACYVVHSGGIATGLSSLVPGVQYFLSDTEGGMSDSPGVEGKAFLVGVAIKTTDLLVICIPVDLNSVTANVQPALQFVEDGNNKAKIWINDSDNLKIRNQSSNQHIVFEINDGGTHREALRIRGNSDTGSLNPEVVVNEGSLSLVDFRVESSSDTHVLFVNGGTDKVGIGVAAPSHKLDINGDIRVRGNDIRDSSGSPAISFDGSTNTSFAGEVGIGTAVPQTTRHVHADSINNGAVTISQSDNSGDASQLDLSKSRGSGSSPTAVQGNDYIGQVRFLAYDGNSYDNFADIYAQALGTPGVSNHESRIILRTTRAGSSSPVTAITIDENQNLIAEGNLEAKDQITIRDHNTPGSSSANGFRGEIRYDTNYIYVCVADNTWKRVALSSW